MLLQDTQSFLNSQGVMPGGITAATIYGTKQTVNGEPINPAPTGTLTAQPSTDTQTSVVPVEQMPISSQPIANITQNLSNPASPIPQILIDKPSLIQTGAVSSSLLSQTTVARLKDLSASYQLQQAGQPSTTETADWRKWLLYGLLAIAIIVLIVIAAKKKKK